ncbi:hypothetical protein [Prevotella sp.]|uniref:hypothetical protein n=1 Tax=Prevotella sp. TaxID=59823 RepID=UPI0030785B16
MQVNRRKDVRTPRVLMHRIADIRGGVSVKASELGGDFLYEGAVLSAADEKGLCHVVKIAHVVAEVGATDKTIKVKKGHNFAKGDFIMTKVGGVAYDITAIDTEGSKTFEIAPRVVLTVIVSKDGFIIEAKAKSTDTTSELKYVPQSINGTGKPFTPKSNLDTDAWLFAVTKGNPLPDCIMAYLKGIVNY